jgi:hypothetical protein
MKRSLFSAITLATILFVSCDKEEVNPIVVPTTYTFERNGSTTVDFNGQTTRIKMADELAGVLKTPTKTEEDLDGMFTNIGNKFSDTALNASTKSIRSKTAASADYFSANTTDAAAIKADFDTWIAAQVDEVYPNWNTDANVGVAGKIQEAGGGSERWVNAKGLEYDQVIVKGLIGALMVDQILNNYLSTAVLDEGTNKTDNDADIVVDGKNYTAMEHKWDEAFGYLYGNEADITNPSLGVDQYLNKYVNRLNNDPDFAEMPDEIYDAFKLGRAAIVAKDYTTRDQQAQVLREKISEIIGIRVVYYLQQAKLTLASDKATAFHDLSEGVGFIYSLQFTRKPNSNEPYFTKSEVETYMNTLLSGNGFWDLTTTTLDELSNTIASRFNFTVIQAGN